MTLLWVLSTVVDVPSQRAFHSGADLVHNGVPFMPNQEVDVGPVGRDRCVISPKLHRWVHLHLASEDGRDIVRVECVVGSLLARNGHDLSKIGL